MDECNKRVKASLLGYLWVSTQYWPSGRQGHWQGCIPKRSPSSSPRFPSTLPTLRCRFCYWAFLDLIRRYQWMVLQQHQDLCSFCKWPLKGTWPEAPKSWRCSPPAMPQATMTTSTCTGNDNSNTTWQWPRDTSRINHSWWQRWKNVCHSMDQIQYCLHHMSNSKLTYHKQT